MKINRQSNHVIYFSDEISEMLFPILTNSCILLQCDYVRAKGDNNRATIIRDRTQERFHIKIEQLRGQMVSLGTSYGFLHPEVQKCSRDLDQLLLQYYAH